MGQIREIVPIERIDRLTNRVQIESGIIPEKLIHGVIGVDLEALLDLMNLGGIDYFSMQARTNKSENTTPNVVGFDAQGVAMAGKAKKIHPNILSGRINDRKNLDIYPSVILRGSNSAWSELNVDVDTQVLKRILIERGQLRDAEAWANLLDEEIRNLLLIKGLANLFYREKDELLSTFTSTVMLISFLYVLFKVVYVIQNMIGILDISMGTFGWSIYSILFNYNIFLSTQFYNHLNEENLPTRFSLFPSLEIERALALVIKSKTRKVFVGKNID